MAKKLTTLYIDNNTLRLMVVEGNQIKQWAEQPIAPELMENAVVVKEEEFTALIKRFLEANQIKEKKIVLGTSGLRCLTRPMLLPPLPETMLDEAVRREAERALPVPLDQLYLSWQKIPSSEEQSQMFAVAVPSVAVDSLLKALYSAGLKPGLLELKPLLLSKLVEKDSAVIVDVQSTEFDIVIMSEGIPQPVRTILLPSGTNDWREILDVIGSELKRTITFFNSNNPEKNLGPDAPVYISGDISYESELCQNLSDEVGYSVIPLELPLAYPEGFVPGRYMANIGLAAGQLFHGKKPGASLVDLNILPAPYLPKPISITNILAIPSAVIAIGLVGFMFLMNQNVAADIVATRGQITASALSLQQKLSQQQTLTNDIAALGANITTIRNVLDNFIAADDGLAEQRTAVNLDLDATILTVPSGITLARLVHITSIMTVSGTAPNEEKVLDYITVLDKSGRFLDVTTTSFIRNENNSIDFTILSILQPQAIGASSLEIALGTLPRSIILTNVDSDESILNIDGISPDEEAIFSYVLALEAGKQFSEITISRISKTDTGEMEFSIILKGIGEE